MINFAGGCIKEGKMMLWERWDIREVKKGYALYWFDTVVPAPINLEELMLLLPTPVACRN